MTLDPRALLIPLLPATVGRNGYTATDRYRDFRAVFFGDATPEQKERVLFQILALAEVHGYLIGQDTHDTYRLLGRREVGMDILTFLTHDPDTKQFVPTTENTTNG